MKSEGTAEDTVEEGFSEGKRARGRPRVLDERSQRVTVRLHGDEYDALVKFAKERYWEKSVALRLILREKLLGEKLPF